MFTQQRERQTEGSSSEPPSPHRLGLVWSVMTDMIGRGEIFTRWINITGNVSYVKYAAALCSPILPPNLKSTNINYQYSSEALNVSTIGTSWRHLFNLIILQQVMAPFDANIAVRLTLTAILLLLSRELK